MHVRELSLTTNTARLAHMALQNSEIRLRGERDQTLDCTDIQEAVESLPLLLFPSDDAHELNPGFLATHLKPGQSVTLVVPDGNWRQCGKVANRVPGLQSMMRVKLAPGALSEYKLRQEPRPECLCTFEAIERALGVLEGKKVEETLHVFFRLKQDRTLWSRGVLKTEFVTGGVPQAAIDSFKTNRVS
jgi:DTW domain-containing protein YfiP